MSKKLLFSLFFMYALSIHSQIADGSVAPNFTATDLNGNSHTLQDYLDDGKTVILNISATWCGPCWNYKQTGALSDVYNAYGENGSDEVVILYVEGDPGTTTADLNGTGPNTVGDWVSSTEFPILDNASIANQYQISFYPTVYRICPDGLVFEMGQLSNSGIQSHINSNCTGTLQGEDLHARVSVDDINLCEDGVSADFTVNVRNHGNTTINNLEFDLNSGNSTVSLSESNLNVSKWSDQTFVVNALLDSDLDNSLSISSLNGANPFSSIINNTEMTVETASPVSTDIVVHIYTDNYPSEITWNIKDDSGTIVASGGPYQAGTDDQWGGGGPDAHTTKVHNVTLPDNEVCYNIELFDVFQDGWGFTDGSVNPGVEIFYDGESVYLQEVGNFGASIEFSSAFRYFETLSTSNFDVYEFNMYPNPSNGTVSLSANESFTYEIFNLQGKQVLKGDVNGISQDLNLSDFASGVYLVKINIDGASKTQKLILN